MWQLTHPLALALAAVPFALGLYFLMRRRTQSKGQLQMSAALEAVRKQSQVTKRWYRLLFVLAAFVVALLSLAIARPIEVQSWIERWSEGVDIILVLDVSESMDATDFEPNRITVTKSIIRDFIRRRTEDRIGLVIFGGESVTKCPLTRDYDFLLSQVDDVRLSELKQGTAIGMGLANAVGRLRYSQSKNRIVILLTDGDSNVGSINPITAANLARQEGIKVYTVGIGRKNRVLVPIYAKDSFGRKRQLIAQVPSYLNPELLKEIARSTGGKAYLARDGGMFNRILREIDSLEKTKVKTIPKSRQDEKFYFPAIAAIILMALVLALKETRFRRIRIKHAA